jgi:hypothetical protein
MSARCFRVVWKRCDSFSKRSRRRVVTMRVRERFDCTFLVRAINRSAIASE